MTYDSFASPWWPYLFILLSAALPTIIWRWLGVLLVGGLNDESEWIVLVRCMSTALVAAVIAQFLFHPTGALATLPLWLRCAAAGSAFAFFLTRGNLLITILLGEAILLGGAFMLDHGPW